MKISQLPPEIQKKAIAHRDVANQDIWDKYSDNLADAFNWFNTQDKSEGFEYWKNWDTKQENEIDIKYQLQQLSTQYPNDLEFGAQVRKLISEL
jgi:hypothetical protein